MAGMDYREVRRAVSMEQVLALLKVSISSRQGVQLRGACPLHVSSQRNRSFSVNLERSVFRCFISSASGNQLDLWAAVTEQDLHRAAIDLCERAGVDVPWVRHW